MLSTDRLEIHLIGGLGIRQGGRAIDLPTHKSEGLLAVLALRPGTDVGRERLSDLPWSRSAPAQARASLRQALNQLRRALESLGPELIEARGDSLRLRRGCVTVEVAELEQALD